MAGEHTPTFPFVPSGPVSDDVVNLWSGFAVEPAQGDVAPFLEFVRDAICAGSADLFDFALAWLTHLVQRPSEKPGTALVLRGAQGTGKSTFADMIAGLFGSHAHNLPSVTSLTRNF